MGAPAGQVTNVSNSLDACRRWKSRKNKFLICKGGGSCSSHEVETSKSHTICKTYATSYTICKTITCNCGISGVRSNFIWPFGSWLSQNNKKLVLPPTKEAVTFFSLNKIQFNLVWASHLHFLFHCRNHHVRTYCDSIVWNNHTWIISWIWVSDCSDRKLDPLDY